MLAEQGTRGRPHRPHGELTGPMPHEPSLERIRPRPRVDPISVLASGRREPGVEPLGRPTHVFDNDLGRKHAVDRPLEALEIDVIGRRRTTPPDPARAPPRPSAPQRTASARHPRRARGRPKGPPRRSAAPSSEPNPGTKSRRTRATAARSRQEYDDGGHEAVTARGEGVPSGVVARAGSTHGAMPSTARRAARGEPPTSARQANRDPYSDPTSSIRAIGAPSPLRCPSLRIRV